MSEELVNPYKLSMTRTMADVTRNMERLSENETAIERAQKAVSSTLASLDAAHSILHLETHSDFGSYAFDAYTVAYSCLGKMRELKRRAVASKKTLEVELHGSKEEHKAAVEAFDNFELRYQATRDQEAQNALDETDDEADTQTEN
jgi:hypothetical protein